MYLVIDGAAIPDREALHDLLARELALPAWYGRNLDALHDCLTDRAEPLDIIFLHQELLEEKLGVYGASLRRVLLDSARENPGLRIYTAEPLK